MESIGGMDMTRALKIFQFWKRWRGKSTNAALAEHARWGNKLRAAEPPGNWPPDLVQEMESVLYADGAEPPGDIGLSVRAGYLLYFHHADRLDWMEANHVISRAVDLLQRLAPGHRTFESLFALYAVHLALRGGNARGARSEVERIAPDSKVRRTSLFLGAQASITLAENDPLAALNMAQSAKKLIAPLIASDAISRVEATWWDEVIARAEALGPASPTPLRAIDGGAPARPVIGAAIARGELFAWDPGVPSDLRTVWFWRGRYLAELELSA
jgi:hypothetical protein